MLDNVPFHCPVCRAKQSLADTCRRCNADLRLVVQVRRRIVFLRERIDKATANDDPHADDLHTVGAWKAELQWLTGTIT